MDKITEFNYSLILYFTEVLEEDIERILDFIKKGITFIM